MVHPLNHLRVPIPGWHPLPPSIKWSTTTTTSPPVHVHVHVHVLLPVHQTWPSLPLPKRCYYDRALSSAPHPGFFITPFSLLDFHLRLIQSSVFLVRSSFPKLTSSVDITTGKQHHSQIGSDSVQTIWESCLSSLILDTYFKALCPLWPPYLSALWVENHWLPVTSNHQGWGCTPPSKVKAVLDFSQPVNRCCPFRNSKELYTFTTASFTKLLLSGTSYMRLWKRDSVFMAVKTALANATKLSHLLPCLQIATDHTVIAFCSCAHVLLHVHINIFCFIQRCGIRCLLHWK